MIFKMYIHIWRPSFHEIDHFAISIKGHQFITPVNLCDITISELGRPETLRL